MPFTDFLGRNNQEAQQRCHYKQAGKDNQPGRIRRERN